MRGPFVDLRLVLSVVLLSTAACSLGGGAEGTGAQAAGVGRGRGGAQAVPVNVAPVVKKAIPLAIRVIGSVEPSSSVAIRAQVTGELTKVNFNEGDDVREGQVLFTLDQRPLEAALKQMEANLERDSAQATNAQAQADRAQELANRGIATREQVETASTTANALQATLAADRAAIENARVQLQYATITAPIAGRTGALQVHPGNLVRANDTTSLVVINQITPINVSFSVPEAQLALLKRYLAQGVVHVEAEPPSAGDKPSTGTITFVDNAVDPTTGTIRVKGSFANAERRLWPGQFVNVVMTLATDPNALVVPSVAVQGGQQGTYVFVVKDDRTVDVRPIEISRTNGDDSIVSKGVVEGESVVTDGQLRLVAGSPVSIKTRNEGGSK
jgi:multidrug efflux system membrane fusion protein